MSETKVPIEGKVEIVKAKLKKGITLIATYRHSLPGGSSTVHTVECKRDAHDDLRRTFSVLAVHLAHLCEQYEKHGEITKLVACRGFSLRGEDENEGFVLTGYRKLESGMALNFNAPFTKFSDEKYGAIDALYTDIERCKDEIMLALFENKYQPDGQMSLFDTSDDDDEPEDEKE